jgi:hypothetical protein
VSESVSTLLQHVFGSSKSHTQVCELKCATCPTKEIQRLTFFNAGRGCEQSGRLYRYLTSSESSAPLHAGSLSPTETSIAERLGQLEMTAFVAFAVAQAKCRSSRMTRSSAPGQHVLISLKCRRKWYLCHRCAPESTQNVLCAWLVDGLYSRSCNSHSLGKISHARTKSAWQCRSTNDLTVVELSA